VPAAGAYGDLGVIDIALPAVAAGQLQVRVVAAAVNPADLKVLRGETLGRFLHARTKPLVTGYDFSGVVEAIGDGVTDVKSGDEVFGFLPYAGSTNQGTFAERVVVTRAEVGKKPAGVAHDVAAASATPGLTALQAMRDHGRLKAGGRVLVLGAAGGVGCLSIGVAHALGAKVSAVCSAYAAEFVKQLGADEVVDRRAKDPRTIEGPFDVVLDAAAAYSYGKMRRQIAANGAYVTTLPSPAWVGGMVMASVSSKRCRMITVKSIAADLEELAGWIAGGTRVPIDCKFPVRDLGQALERLTKGELKGRIAVDVEEGW
jgi:NADPH:quinone reductase-like Zn-dependent oxidoreductase